MMVQPGGTLGETPRVLPSCLLIKGCVTIDYGFPWVFPGCQLTPIQDDLEVHIQLQKLILASAQVSELD